MKSKRQISTRRISTGCWLNGLQRLGKAMTSCYSYPGSRWNPRWLPVPSHASLRGDFFHQWPFQERRVWRAEKFVQTSSRQFNLQILDKLWLKSSPASKEINVLERGNDLAGRRSSFWGKLGKIVKFQGPLWKDVQFPSTRKHKIPLYVHSIKVAKAITVLCWLSWSNLLFSFIYILSPFNLWLRNKISVLFLGENKFIYNECSYSFFVQYDHQRS